MQLSRTPVTPSGKRKAVKPSRADRRKAVTVTAAPAARTSSAPAVPAVPAARHTGHSGHAGSRRNLFPGLPSAPTLVGAAALAFAAVGATVSQQSTALASDDYDKFSAQASVLNAATSVGSSDALAGRQRAVSRDSQRSALQDAATAELQDAAAAQARQRNAALASLAASAERHANQIAANLWQLPLPAGSFRLNDSFGQCSYLWANCHTGEDFSAPSGTPVLSVAAGVVTEAGYEGSYGYKTVITHEDGTETWYAHQTQILVSVGETVRAGEQIGTVGSTGNSTGPHLHLEVRPGGGDPVDPVEALRVRGVAI
ncbi:MAG TPA: M23 family metallopeptidase [Nocardioides sp.]|nr:M23 family metallopeptidase [Nocardioides sp.]